MMRTLLDQVNVLIHSPLRHGGLVLSSIADIKLGDSDQTIIRKVEMGFNKVLPILNEKYGKPIYEGIGPLYSSYAGPPNPGFRYNFKDVVCIAWWKVNNYFLSLTVNTSDGGLYPRLEIEYFNLMGTQNQATSGFEIV